MAESKKGMLADLFDGTFRTLSRTWRTALVCGGVLFIIPALVYGWSFGRLFDALRGLADIEDPVELLPLGIAYAWIVLAVLLQGFAGLFVRACVTEHTARVARGENARLADIMGRVLTRSYGKLIGQRALQYTILGVTVAAASSAGGLFFAIAGISETLPLILPGVVLMLGGYAVVIWFSIRWSVTLESVVVEDVKIEQSLDRSSALVAGAWWRVSGFMLLLGMMVGFAVSLIATPLVFFATIKSYAQFLGGLLGGAQGDEDLPFLLQSLFSGMGPRLGILMYIQSLFAGFVTPVFMTLLFLELRKRTDLPQPQPQPPGPVPVTAELPSAP